MSGFTITDAQARHEQAPADPPLRTAVGTITARHAVFVILRDDAGREGVGESWVNFPHWSPWERLAAFKRAFIPYLRGRTVEDIPRFMAETYRAFVGPARQSGTIGPLLGELCGIELALWDLAAQVAGLPLARFLFGPGRRSVRVYASGVGPPLPWDLIELVEGDSEEVEARVSDLAEERGVRAEIAWDGLEMILR